MTQGDIEPLRDICYCLGISSLITRQEGNHKIVSTFQRQISYTWAAITQIHHSKILVKPTLSVKCAYNLPKTFKCYCLDLQPKKLLIIDILHCAFRNIIQQYYKTNSQTPLTNLIDIFFYNIWILEYHIHYCESAFKCPN